MWSSQSSGMRSAAIRATPSGMPMPRFAIAPGGSSSQARAAMIRRSSSAMGAGRSAWPAEALQ